jgi:hypothetical protein
MSGKSFWAELMTNLTKPATSRRGGFDSFVATVPRAAVSALDVKSVPPQEIAWHLGEERILLTIGGLALGIVFSLRLP